MLHQLVSRKLSRSQVDLLLDHVDGTAFVESGVVMDERNATRASLVRLRLILYVGGSDQTRPTFTRVTEDGRMVLCYALADYAEMLIRAGYGVDGCSAISSIAQRIASGLPLVDPASEVAEAEHLREAAQL